VSLIEARSTSRRGRPLFGIVIDVAPYTLVRSVFVEGRYEPTLRAKPTAQRQRLRLRLQATSNSWKRQVTLRGSSPRSPPQRLESSRRRGHQARSWAVRVHEDEACRSRAEDHQEVRAHTFVVHRSERRNVDLATRQFDRRQVLSRGGSTRRTSWRSRPTPAQRRVPIPSRTRPRREGGRQQRSRTQVGL
jgi:hypothetical protein